jgi:hypothetical protein
MLSQGSPCNKTLGPLLGLLGLAVAAIPSISVAAPASSASASIVPTTLAGKGLTDAELGRVRGGFASPIGSAAPYVAWLSAAAANPEVATGQARAATSAYETALAATVPPALIAANRAALASLVATNFFGQNAPAIAATETQYGQMWAQDAAAMAGYLQGSLSPAKP